MECGFYFSSLSFSFSTTTYCMEIQSRSEAKQSKERRDKSTINISNPPAKRKASTPSSTQFIIAD
jgi:hypothetical protein